MLGLAKRTSATMLLASTSEVYGDPAEHPQKETYWGNVNPIGPRACYDEGKRVAETMCYAYNKQGGVDVRVARSELSCVLTSMVYIEYGNLFSVLSSTF